MSEIKSKEQKEKIISRAEDRLNAVLKNPLTAIRAELGEGQAVQEGKIVTLYQGTDSEKTYDMNRKEDVARLAKDLETSEFGADASTDAVLVEIDELIEQRREKNKLP